MMASTQERKKRRHTRPNGAATRPVILRIAAVDRTVIRREDFLLP